jgi:hypothetical protein
MTLHFSQQGMAALPLNVRTGTSGLVRRLVNARNDPAKARILTWLLNINDERLGAFGLLPREIAILRHQFPEQAALTVGRQLAL